MKKAILILTIIGASLISSGSYAVPGDYSLRFKAGPSFNLADYETQVKFGGQFDYDLGYGWGVGLEVLMGVRNHFLFQMMPQVRFTLLYIGPAELNIFGSLGYEVFGRSSAFGTRFGSGLILPLGSKFEIVSDVSMNITPAGTPGVPTALDWLIGIGTRFGGGQQ